MTVSTTPPLRFAPVGQDDPLAAPLLAELATEYAQRYRGGYRRVYPTTGDRQPEAQAPHLATGYPRLAEPLPAQGEVYPVAFEKRL